MSDLSADGLVQAAKDSLYVSVGLGLIAFQRVQVRRHELSRQTNATGLSKLVDDNLKMVEERMHDAEERIEAVLDDVATKLPDPAREVMSTARTAAREARNSVRKLL